MWVMGYIMGKVGGVYISGITWKKSQHNISLLLLLLQPCTYATHLYVTGNQIYTSQGRIMIFLYDTIFLEY